MQGTEKGRSWRPFRDAGGEEPMGGGRRRPVTERAHPSSGDLDRLSARAVVRLVLQEDCLAVRRLASEESAVARGAKAIASALGKGGRLIYVGAGTSGRLGALDAAEWPPTFGIPRSRVRVILAGGPKALSRAVEGAEDSDSRGAAEIRRSRVGPDDVVCGISASGRTPFVIGALRQAGRAGATRILISSGAASTAPGEIRIRLRTGPEILSGSTRMKAGIATHTVLQAMSTTAAVLCGRVLGNRMVGMRATNRKLRERALGILSEVCGISIRRASPLLKEAKGEVDTAILMGTRGISPAAARKILRGESLRSALKGSSK